MRSGGINWLAVIAAAVAIYVIGFVIYGMLVPDLSMAGMTEAEKATAMSRLMYSPLMPIMTAVFLAVLFKWGSVADAVAGVKWAVVVGLASAVPTMLYGWVYGGLQHRYDDGRLCPLATRPHSGRSDIGRLEIGCGRRRHPRRRSSCNAISSWAFPSAGRCCRRRPMTGLADWSRRRAGSCWRST